MKAIQIELTFKQLFAAVQKLPRELKVKLWQFLDAEIMQRDMERDFKYWFVESQNAAQEVDEDEAMADALAAIAEYRAEQAARGS